MKVQYNNTIIDLKTIEEPSIIVILDSLRYEKSRNYNDLFLLWENHFKQFQIPIWIITPDLDQEDLYIKYAKDIDVFKTFDSMNQKVVFGKTYNIISTKMVLIKNGNILFEQKRINSKSIKALYIKAIETKYKIFIKKLKNSVDIPNNLW